MILWPTASSGAAWCVSRDEVINYDVFTLIVIHHENDAHTQDGRNHRIQITDHRKSIKN